ncbi:MAG: hypothetical protein MUO91_05415 [candidate division Zixibacteria bacterium]|nr:hypothetical protein [candidate division Zixibacteria bacterium]
MHFIFGYQREIPVKIRTKASIIALVGLAILIILLLIFLSFENLDGSIPPLVGLTINGEILTHTDIPASHSTFDDLVFLEMSNQMNSLGDLAELFFDFSNLVC